MWVIDDMAGDELLRWGEEARSYGGGQGGSGVARDKGRPYCFSAGFSLAAAAACWLVRAAGAEADADAVVSSCQICCTLSSPWRRPLHVVPNANIGISLLISFLWHICQETEPST